MYDLEREDWPKPAGELENSAFWREQARRMQRLMPRFPDYAEHLRGYIRECQQASREKRAPDFRGIPAPFPPNDLSYEALERLAIRTIDGKMTDEEALDKEGLKC